MIYCGTLWWTPEEQELLDVKFSEGRSVDQWIICQATTSFRGRSRTICYPETPEWAHVEQVICDTSNVKGTHIPANRKRNAIQRNAILGLIRDVMKPDDVFVFCDLDEIVHETDWDEMVSAALEHGLVYATMRRYYGKINLQASSPWDSAFAASGEFLNKDCLTVDGLRQRHKTQQDPRVTTSGQHFGWLYPGTSQAILRHKSKNNCRRRLPESRTPQNILRGRTPSGGKLERVKVDESYPVMMRNNMEYWSEYMAK